ncbi:unnamed protein product [Mytilus coruscus]|uniref:THAP-type domain-containing protein n=1 Tax=Mytilus coruscus TaxID=42192 RepID=A0A6J8B893_MYTCO|nr:unnamed protein product [Mytilus coruscus]
MAKRNCAVFKCTQNGKKLTKWREIHCEIHDCNKGTCRCICEPPFKLFPFPTKDLEDRKLWIKVINRQQKKGKIWEPNYDSRVCSEHFLDGHPSEANPYPTLKLGYDPIKRPRARRPPLDRSLLQNQSPVKKPRHDSEDVSFDTEPMDVPTCASSVLQDEQSTPDISALNLYTRGSHELQNKSSTSNISNTEDLNTNISNTEDLNTYISNTEDLNTNISNTEDLNTNISNTEDLNTSNCDHDYFLNCEGCMRRDVKIAELKQEIYKLKKHFVVKKANLHENVKKPLILK